MKELLELESPQNLAFERRSWWVERAGWLALALFLAAALAGLLGPGPLSTRRARTPDGALAIEYPRFMRVRSAGEIRVRVRAAPRPETELWLDGGWTARLRVLGVTPPPARSELRGDLWVLVFTTPGAAPARELELTLDVEPRSAGRLDGAVALPSGARLAVRQLVYP